MGLGVYSSMLQKDLEQGLQTYKPLFAWGLIEKFRAKQKTWAVQQRII